MTNGLPLQIDDRETEPGDFGLSVEADMLHVPINVIKALAPTQIRTSGHLYGVLMHAHEGVASILGWEGSHLTNAQSALQNEFGTIFGLAAYERTKHPAAAKK